MTADRGAISRSADSPTVAAARRVLDALAAAPVVDRPLAERCAWLLAAAGAPVPRLPGEVEDRGVRLAQAAGRGDGEAFRRLLADPSAVREDDLFLLGACRLGGLRWPEPIVDAVERHPGIAFDGRLLARTTRPERLLALVPGSGLPTGAAVATVAEVVLAGRDSGRPVRAAERRWAPIAAEAPDDVPAYRDAALRVAVREDLEGGITLLARLGEEWSRWRIGEGAVAVLARLALVDPDRAAAIVGAGPRPADRLAWLPGLAWWTALPPAAVPLVEDLFAAADPDVDLTLAGALAGTPEVGLLERALAEADASDPLEVAGTLAVGLARLRAAASGRVVARVRAACRAHLPADAAPGEVVAPRDLLEVLSTPEPASEPWGVSPPGVP